MLKFTDYLYILWISFKKTIIVLGIILFLVSVIIFNHYLGISIADALKIPHDFTLTVTSFGFVNNITIVFTVLEFGLIGFILHKFRIINSIFDYVFDFID